MITCTSGFFAPDGVAFVLTLLSAAVAFVITGPGGYSLDALLARRKVQV